MVPWVLPIVIVFIISTLRTPTYETGNGIFASFYGDLHINLFGIILSVRWLILVRTTVLFFPVLLMIFSSRSNSTFKRILVFYYCMYSGLSHYVSEINNAGTKPVHLHDMLLRHWYNYTFTRKWWWMTGQTMKVHKPFKSSNHTCSHVTTAHGQWE